jgi:predicted lipoprotein with Yx(FWY)xxD motif
MKFLLQICAGLAVLALVACGDDDSGSENGSATAGSGGGAGDGAAKLTSNHNPPAPGTTIKTAGSQFGKVLFSKSSRAIYYFAKETGRAPKCFGNCAEAWPPVLTKGKPQAAGSVKQNLLGTTQRGGKKQVTYKGHPLYFYVDDPKGEVLCHDIEEFGGLWLAVKPDGSSPPTS